MLGKKLCWFPIWLVVFGLLLGACNPQNLPVTPEPKATVAPATATITLTVTTASTPTPSATPTATFTPLPPTATATFTPVPLPLPPLGILPSVTPNYELPQTKQIFIMYGGYGGDGGSETDEFFGRGTPAFALYEDGQLVIQQGDWGERQFLTTMLTPAEVCGLYNNIAATGFLEPPADGQYFTQEDESMGAPVLGIRVDQRYYSFYAPSVPYLIPYLAEGWQVLENYTPPHPLTLYEPTELVLWVENVEEVDELEGAEILAWSAEFPTLQSLRPDPEMNQVELPAEWVQPVFSLFEHTLKELYFQEGELVYRVIARPVLPHETADDFREFWTHLQHSPEYVSAFNCQGEPAFTAALTPTPTALPDPLLAPLLGQGYVAYLTIGGGYQAEIWVMEANGTHKTRLTYNLSEEQTLAWSPDGQWLAFASDQDGDFELYIMRPDGSDVQQLTFNEVDDYSPTWSPDGSQMAYVTEPNHNWEKAEIFILSLTGSFEPYRITNHNYRSMMPIWSPTGQTLLYTQQHIEGFPWPSFHYVMDLTQAGFPEQPLVSPAGFTPQAWSADGNHILLTGQEHKIQIRDTAGELVQNFELPEYEFIRSAAWLANEQYILFTYRTRLPDNLGGYMIESSAVLNTQTGEILALPPSRYGGHSPAVWP